MTNLPADPVTRYTLRHARFGANEILVADRNGELVLHTSYLQLQHERDCAIEDVKRLTLILAQVHALANPRLLLSTAGAEIVKLTREFAPAEPDDVGDEHGK